MDKVSPISFKGKTNIGAIDITEHALSFAKIITRLTDETTPDLTRFKDVFEKYPDPLRKNYLRVLSEYVETDYAPLIGQFSINGLPFSISYENFPIVAKVLALLTDIRDLAHNDAIPGKAPRLIIEDSYLKSNDCSVNLKIKEMGLTGYEADRMIHDAHTPSTIEIVADTISKFILSDFAQKR